MSDVNTKTISLSMTGSNALYFILALGVAFVVAPGSGLADDAAPSSVAEWTRQLQQALQDRNSPQAVAILDRLIEAVPDNSRFHYLRGCENLRVRSYGKSVADFDRYLELAPERKESLWERGISCYFAGQYREGAEQFALYQNYHDQDVENSVWRYLCIAKTDGTKKARETLLPIKRDPRPGLMEVFQMYQGTVSPEELLEAARTTSLPEEAAAGFRFYTYLYVGFFYWAEDKPAQARDVLSLAADPQLFEAGRERISRYMWDVAVIAQHEVVAEIEANSGKK